MTTIMLEGKKYVILPEAEYRQLLRSPVPLPAPDADGNYPALAAADSMIANALVRDRASVGLSQKELAEAAGIRVEVLNRAERGVNVPNVRTMMKIEAALGRAGLKRGGPAARMRRPTPTPKK